MRPATIQRVRRQHRATSSRAPRLVELAPSTGVAEAVHRMQLVGQALALVVRANDVVGVVDIEDLRFARGWMGQGATVADAMTMRITERACVTKHRDVRPY